MYLPCLDNDSSSELLSSTRLFVPGRGEYVASALLFIIAKNKTEERRWKQKLLQVNVMWITVKKNKNKIFNGITPSTDKHQANNEQLWMEVLICFTLQNYGWI